jgi:transglutaminase-like putative cysteine protease
MSVDFARHLLPTRFLDADHPAVAAFARAAAEGAATERERAVRVFRAVRDGIRYDPYAVDLAPEALSASATLARRRAFCVPKAVLLAACLRSLSIPTRLGFADVTNHLATPRLLARLRTDVFAFHGYVDVWLDGRWIKATPAFDAALCAWFGVAPLEWDGSSDAVFQAHDSSGRRFMEYRCDRGVHDDLPYAELLRVWHELYPHMFEEGAFGAPGGDFAAEAVALRAGR